MKNLQVYLLLMILLLLAISLFGYKLVVLDLPLNIDPQVNTWDVEVTLSFHAHGKPVKVELYLPQSEGHSNSMMNASSPVTTAWRYVTS